MSQLSNTPCAVPPWRRNERMLALSCAALLTTAPVHSTELQQLEWYRPDFAPFFILNGPERNQGFGDVLVQELMKRLPQYQQRVFDAPLGRALEGAQQGETLICTAPLLRTPERAAHLHFSHAFFTSPANGVMIRARERERFAPFIENGKLSLTRLLATGKFTLGINGNRSYGDATDAALAAHREQPYVVAKLRQGYINIALSALSKGSELDVVLAYQLEAAYWVHSSRSPVALAFLEIVEANPNEAWYIACSGTEQGASAIVALNQVLADSSFQQIYLQAYSAWWALLVGAL